MNLRMLTVLGAMLGGLVLTGCPDTTPVGTGGAGGGGGEGGGGNVCTPVAEVCDDMIDNDCDEKVDADDSDCAVACVKCAEHATNVLAGTASTVCADDPATMGTSTTLFTDLITCACSQGCANECAASSVCMMGGAAPDMACQTCIQTGACSTPFGACANDI